jgi:hypothetical protein
VVNEKCKIFPEEYNHLLGGSTGPKKHKSESALNQGKIFSFHTKKSKRKMAGGGSYLPVYTVVRAPD